MVNTDNNDNPQFLNPLGTIAKEGVSLFTAIKNRRESFEDALKTWVSLDQIDEIIIVDWSSDQSLIPLIQKYQNGKIVLAVAGNQPKWVLSYAYNLAARLTTRTRLLKIDADVKIMPDFFEKHILRPGRFFCGNWRIRRNDNEMHLNGIVWLYREDFFRVNGYNEFIKIYGWDDSDLYQRLENAGLMRDDFDLDTLYHIPHENRTSFQERPAYLGTIPDSEWAMLATLVNRHLVNTFCKWSPSRPMMSFTIVRKDEFTFDCCQNSTDLNQVPREWIQDSELVAIRERIPMLGIRISEETLGQLSRSELLEVYCRHFSGSQKK